MSQSSKGMDLREMIREAMREEMAKAAKPAAQRPAPKAAPMGLTLRVSPKGAVSVYGLGRFPVTLYGNQWTRVLGEAGEIRRFIEANKDRLATLDK